MPQKKTLKPTFILALDPFAAAFCAEARRRLECQLGTAFNGRNSLIQACALTEGGNALQFDLDIDAYLDSRREYTNFDLAKTRALLSASDSGEAQWLSGNWRDQAADALSDILLGARSLGDLEAARRAGFDVSDARLIYLVLSSSYPFAVNVVLELARVIHWLFATRFQDALYTLHALVLMPELFANHGTPDYVTTYGLLKKLDDAFANGLSVLARLKPRPFEDCWLIDGHNQRVIGTGTLAENLAGYADAFVGLLSAGTEDSMAAPGMNSRGKPPAYNSFGYGELYLPLDVVITRLGAALAHDVTLRFFLGEPETVSHDGPQLLNDISRFVASKEFTVNLEQVRRHGDGYAIWQPPNLRERLREDAPDEYIEVLRRRDVEFDRGPMAEYRSALSDSGQRVLDELTLLLDAEIDHRADVSPTGLQDAIEYLRIMVEPSVELRQPFGEDPQNLLTVLREVEAMLDMQLGITPQREESTALREEILDLCNSLSELRTDLRLLPVSANQQEMPDPQGPPLNEEPSDEESSYSEPELPNFDESTFVGNEPDFPDNPWQRLSAMTEEAEERLRELSDNYRRIVSDEDRAIDALRSESIKRVMSEKLQKIEDNEKALGTRAEELRQARRDHRELLEQQQRFMRRYLVGYPGLIVVVFLVIVLFGWLGDIWPVMELVTLAVAYLPQFILVILLIAVLYFAGVFWAFFRGLRTSIAKAEARITQLDSQLQFTATQLLEARNAYQLFRYEHYAWRMRRDAVVHLIETAHSRINTLIDRLGALRESANIFAQERDESFPLASPMRRPLILEADIDAYYSKKITSIESEGDLFVQTHKVTRSLVWRITPEEFRDRLRTFAVERFKHLRDLCITDAIFHYPDLVPQQSAELRLRELDEAAEPLLRLRRGDGYSAGRLAQRDTTLWVSAQERDRMLEVYRHICPSVNIRIGDDDSSLRVLTRCLYFPAYFIGSIEFYRDRYVRSLNKIADELPDVLPLDVRLKRARKRFLLALATGVIVRSPTGVYTFSDDLNGSFGTDRQHIAERLSSSLDAQKLYEELDDRLDRHLKTAGSVVNQLHEFLNCAVDLEASERQILSALMNEYF
jgi:hypothetical protein